MAILQAMAEVRSTFHVRIGDELPPFDLPDAWGKWHASVDRMGTTGLLVVFACNHCPYVVHLADRLGQKAREWAAWGVETVAIVSNDLDRYPQDGPEAMKDFSQRHGWDFPYLIDATQDVALAFGAACTPDFFLFAVDGRLVYAGQFDDTRPSRGAMADGSDLDRAVRLMRSGQPCQPGRPASGCNIKWKADKQPRWWNAG